MSESVNIVGLNSHGTAEEKSTAAPRAAGSQGGIPGISDILASMDAGVELPAVAKEYIKQVVEGLGVYLNQPQRLGTTRVEVTATTHLNNLMAIQQISVGKAGVTLLGFQETYTPLPDKAYVSAAEILENAAKELVGQGIPVVTTLVIDQGSYTMALKMAAYLGPIYLTRLRPETFMASLASLTQSDARGNKTRFRIITRIGDVRREIERVYPLSVIPPTNSGLIVQLLPNDPSQKPYNLLTVGAYTDFTSDGRVKEEVFTPSWPPIGVCTVTSIISQTPSVGMCAFGLALAADGLINRQLWRDEFRNFSAKPSVRRDENADVIPNIGNLILGDSGKPLHIGDNVKFDEFIMNFLSHMDNYGRPMGRDRVLLALDVTYGAPRIPGIEKFAGGSVTREVCGFLGCEPDVFFTAPNGATLNPGLDSTHIQYIGATNSGQDTRKFNYLTLTAEDPANAMEHRLMALRNNDPSYQLDLLSRLHGNIGIRSLYTRIRVIVNPLFLNQVIGQIGPYINISWETDTRIINNTGVMPIEQAIMTGAMHNFGNQYATNGMGNIYGGYAR